MFKLFCNFVLVIYLLEFFGAGVDFNTNELRARVDFVLCVRSELIVLNWLNRDKCQWCKLSTVKQRSEESRNRVD